MLQWKSRTCLPILNVVHQYPIHCHYPLLLSNKMSLSIFIIQYLVIIHYHYIQYIICVPGARPPRKIACVHPSFPPCRHRHEYTEVNKYKIYWGERIQNIPRWINTKYTEVNKYKIYPDRRVKQILYLSDNLRNSLLLITFRTLWALTCLAMEPSQLLTNILFGNKNV